MTVRIRLPSVSLVVARSEPGHVIGCDNALPWRLRTDLQNFKKLTSNHAVIMGRRTYESIGRPLPNRINIVLSSRAGTKQAGVYFAHDKSSALYLADLMSVLNGYDEIFVIGGGAIYREFPFNKVHLTEVHAPNIKGDTFFDEKFDMRSWKIENEQDYPASEIDDYPFTIKVLKKRDKTTYKYRTPSLVRFFTVDQNLAAWEAAQLQNIHLPHPVAGNKWLDEVQLEFPHIRDQIVLDESA